MHQRRLRLFAWDIQLYQRSWLPHWGDARCHLQKSHFCAFLQSDYNRPAYPLQHEKSLSPLWRLIPVQLRGMRQSSPSLQMWEEVHRYKHPGQGHHDPSGGHHLHREMCKGSGYWLQNWDLAQRSEILNETGSTSDADDVLHNVVGCTGWQNDLHIIWLLQRNTAGTRPFREFH